tara:strand:+ start:433 stop:537 length:105 start_codon:yes stop_codon:yes gene_type:complete
LPIYKKAPQMQGFEANVYLGSTIKVRKEELERWV